MNVLLLLLYAQLALCTLPDRDPLAHSAFTPGHLKQLRNRTQLLFQHGWHSYMDHGFPADEVRPITCVPYGPQFTTPENLHNDVLGNVSSTVLDNIDTLIMMREWDELERVLAHLARHQAGFFAQNHVVQVFEASIRWLGGLLSAHLALSEVAWKEDRIRDIAARYDGFLLQMAYDLGLRLIPAYKTSTRLPLPRINLALGLDHVPTSKNRDACTAGATTPFLEFALLSRLTGDARFERLTRSTVDKLWSARSPLGLLPMSLDPIGNKWSDEVTGIGASVDSFYEYALKGAIVLDDDSLFDVFSRSYQSLVALSAFKAEPDGWTYFANIHTSTAVRMTAWIDSLSAFWPGLQVLAGQLSDAVSSHLIFLKIWDHFDSIPERWETLAYGTETSTHEEQVKQATPLEWYPLRPEFIESTYYLYRATREPMYLQIGVRVLDLFENRYRAPCGFAGYQNIRTGQRQDRMETFVLGESLKYLYLLFDDANESYVHSAGMTKRNWVFSTEAHPLWLSKEIETKSQGAFRPFLSHDKTKYKQFRGRGLLGSMWRGLLQPSNELDPQISEIYDPVVTIGSSLRPAFGHLSVCERRPSQWNESVRFLGSGYYRWDRLFAPNNAMGKSLLRPTHLDTHGGNSVIELSPAFREIYGLSSGQICALPATTTQTEFQIGPLVRPEQYEMYEVSETVSTLPFTVADLVMPELSGRFRVEHLTENSIDGKNTLVTRKYLEGVQPNNSTSYNRSEVLRVRFVNGIQVNQGTNLWTTAGYLGSSPGVFTTTENGDVYLVGKYVENLKVY